MDGNSDPFGDKSELISHPLIDEKIVHVADGFEDKSEPLLGPLVDDKIACMIDVSSESSASPASSWADRSDEQIIEEMDACKVLGKIMPTDDYLAMPVADQMRIEIDRIERKDIRRGNYWPPNIDIDGYIIRTREAFANILPRSKAECLSETMIVLSSYEANGTTYTTAVSTSTGDIDDIEGEFYTHGTVIGNFDGRLFVYNVPDNFRAFLMQAWDPFADVIRHAQLTRKHDELKKIDGFGSSSSVHDPDSVEVRYGEVSVIGDNFFNPDEYTCGRIKSLLSVPLEDIYELHCRIPYQMLSGMVICCVLGYTNRVFILERIHVGRSAYVRATSDDFHPLYLEVCEKRLGFAFYIYDGCNIIPLKGGLKHLPLDPSRSGILKGLMDSWIIRDVVFGEKIVIYGRPIVPLGNTISKDAKRYVDMLESKKCPHCGMKKPCVFTHGKLCCLDCYWHRVPKQYNWVTQDSRTDDMVAKDKEIATMKMILDKASKSPAYLTENATRSTNTTLSMKDIEYMVDLHELPAPELVPKPPSTFSILADRCVNGFRHAKEWIRLNKDYVYAGLITVIALYAVFK